MQIYSKAFTNEVLGKRMFLVYVLFKPFLESHCHSHLTKYTHQNSSWLIQMYVMMAEDCSLISIPQNIKI